MKLEDQVCSLALSKRLKELGVKQSSIISWFRYNDGKYELECDDADPNFPHEYISAFTAAECGELIPPKHYNFYKNESGYVFSLFGEPNTTDRNLANAMAKMLIYLIENKLMEVRK